jgi:hypothetical protein
MPMKKSKENNTMKTLLMTMTLLWPLHAQAHSGKILAGQTPENVDLSTSAAVVPAQRPTISSENQDHAPTALSELLEAAGPSMNTTAADVPPVTCVDICTGRDLRGYCTSWIHRCGR